MIEVNKLDPRIKRCNYLIVDDDSFSRNLTRTSLKQYGVIDIFDASNAVDAIEILKKQKIDMILLDQEMPGLTGLELAKVIREGKDGVTNTKVLIVMLTNFADKDNVVEAKRLGIQDFLVKPISPEKLMSRIINIFSTVLKK